MNGEPRPISWKSRRDQRCGNCAAFVTSAVTGGQNNAVGSCCLHPPTPFVGHSPNPQATVNPKAPPVVQVLQSMWPPVRIDQWCHDWTPKVEGAA